ncbi:MAG TPA: HlyD family secretion protein [Candidatus Acidoferrum sp.]|nr:HlyD family secretion protein [Candidatus Acidoferrum sp.]
MDTREAAQGTAGQARPNGSTDTVPAIEERTGPRKRVIFGVIGAIVAILLLVWGVKWFLYARVHEGTDDARVDADPVAVTSKINERIDQILVDTNDEVKKGQLLIVLDNSVERDQVRNAEAQLALASANQSTNTLQSQGGVAQAQADTADADAGVAQARAQLIAALAQLPAAQAAYDRASADYHRTASLVKTGDVPRQQLDAQTASLAAAAAQLHSARAQISVAQANLDAAQQRVAAAQGGEITAQGKLAQSSDPSQVQAAHAQLAIAKKNLGYTRIYSPINGYVGEKSAEVGQTVSAGVTILTLIPDGPGQIYITANYKETQMGDMKVGQAADIHVDAYGGQTFHGHVISINPASQNTYALVPAQNATGNFVKVTQRIPVRISIDDMTPDRPLRPGMSVETYVKVR